MDNESNQEYRLEEQVGFLLRKANQRHLAICSELIGGVLTPVQFSILYQLSVEPAPVSQNALGRMVAMDAATTRGVVSRLKSQGLIVSQSDKEDKRRYMLSLTEHGQNVLKQLIPRMFEITRETLSPLEPYEREMFIALLRKLT